ncbi:hypothetical protein NONI108955_18235 [Nocardia ninae]|uniref:Uncharacterized protein n=1 Tax=Nocardia ninae NBRC 108245 TaxID=1210091 RepID=A0A511MBD2_9NOCA|nr:hypothetical protein [Nocardia ninae]GEM37930.1 hypothetical protein NN4_24490 [Nocardia ninae NBRC 108245]
MGTTPIEPRALTELEASVVTTLLSSSGKAGAGDYLAQVPFARVIATWGDGSPSVDLMVPPDVAAVSGSTNGIFIDGGVTDRNGAPIGEVILWVEDGRLGGIEYTWYTDERPKSLPDPSQIEVS